VNAARRYFPGIAFDLKTAPPHHELPGGPYGQGRPEGPAAQMFSVGIDRRRDIS